MDQAKAVVEAYVHKLLPPPRFVLFLGWSDFSESGPSSSITLKYHVQSPDIQPVVANVRFTLEGM